MLLIKSVTVAVLILLSTPILADVSVRGYTRHDGTYVKPHYRSNPDGNPDNNWSTKGNTNPYTGKEGTQDPHSSHQNQW